MQHTHSSNVQSDKHKNARETRKGIGEFPSEGRWHVEDSRIPAYVYHFHFVNPTPLTGGKGRIRLNHPIHNVSSVYLDSLYCNSTGIPVLFSVGVQFIKSVDSFTPNILHSNGNLPDGTIWIHPTYETNTLGAGTYIIKDENQRLLRNYRSAVTLSEFEVQLIDETGSPVQWSEMNMDLRFETLDWQ